MPSGPTSRSSTTRTRSSSARAPSTAPRTPSRSSSTIGCPTVSTTSGSEPKTTDTSATRVPNTPSRWSRPRSRNKPDRAENLANSRVCQVRLDFWLEGPHNRPFAGRSEGGVEARHEDEDKASQGRQVEAEGQQLADRQGPPGQAAWCPQPAEAQ